MNVVNKIIFGHPFSANVADNQVYIQNLQFMICLHTLSGALLGDLVAPIHPQASSVTTEHT